jgi:hypothetical protein
MAVATAIFVSNRLQRMTAAFLCLMAMQLVLASCDHTELVPGFAPGAAIVSIDR